MNEILIGHLRRRQEVEFRHINTQVSTSLADKGSRQWRKAIVGTKHIAQYLGLLVRFRPEVIYLPLTNSVSFIGFLRDAIFISLGRLFSAAIVVHLHAGYCRYTRYQGWRRWLVAGVLGRATAAIVLGEALRPVVAGFVQPGRVFVVPNGIDGGPFRYAAAQRAARAAANLPRQALFVGWLHPAKGVTDILLSASRVPQASFNLVGDWSSDEYRQEALAIVGRDGLQDRVVFRGVLSGRSKIDAFASADVFVFPTYYDIEGHPVVVVEALAAGLPVVCTDQGALSESVIDGWNGYLVPRQDPAALAERLNELFRNDELRQLMGQRSRKLFDERFSADRFVDSWLEVVRRSHRLAQARGMTAQQ
ncbi:MAG: glycosyltransferase family 4 protein [Anaerolineales bacterium]|nr:glycosyltransferase family 4 protein [Anaerolineales bacterium]